MKKIFLFSTIAIGLSLASCVKDRTCTCNYTDTDYPSDNSTHKSTIKATKKAAKKTCEAGNYTIGTESVKCTLD